jgi:hypothetical protein
MAAGTPTIEDALQGWDDAVKMEERALQTMRPARVARVQKRARRRIDARTIGIIVALLGGRHKAVIRTQSVVRWLDRVRRTTPITFKRASVRLVPKWAYSTRPRRGAAPTAFIVYAVP